MPVPIRDDRHIDQPWLTLVILLLLIGVSTILFWLTDLDIRFSAIFFAPPPTFDTWPQEFNPLWQLSFYGAPILAAFLTIGAITTLILVPHHSPWRSYAIYILLTLAIGPGLLINLVFKDHWGRPRPYQIQAFGGTAPYLPPLVLGVSSAHKSFPAGHASIGFSLCMFWFLWRKRYPRRAKFALFGSIFLGLFMGLGRIATGSHFLSDVLWAGFISFFVAWMLYYWVLQIPNYAAAITHNTSNIDNWNHSQFILYLVLSLIVLSGILLGFPINKIIDYSIPDELLPVPTHWRLNLRYANITIYLGGPQVTPLHIIGKIQGFGLPTYKIDSRGYINPNDKTLEYLFRQRGFFTELNTNLRINIDASQLKQLTVRVHAGDILVITAHGIVVPKLDLKTLQGKIWQ